MLRGYESLRETDYRANLVTIGFPKRSVGENANHDGCHDQARIVSRI